MPPIADIKMQSAEAVPSFPPLIMTSTPPPLSPPSRRSSLAEAQGVRPDGVAGSAWLSLPARASGGGGGGGGGAAASAGASATSNVDAQPLHTSPLGPKKAVSFALLDNLQFAVQARLPVQFLTLCLDQHLVGVFATDLSCRSSVTDKGADVEGLLQVVEAFENSDKEAAVDGLVEAVEGFEAWSNSLYHAGSQHAVKVPRVTVPKLAWSADESHLRSVAQDGLASRLGVSPCVPTLGKDAHRCTGL